MSELVLIFQGTDLVIPRDSLLRLGLQPGDPLIIKPESAVAVPDRLDEVLEQLYGSWGPEDEAAFDQQREAMWATWKPRSW